MTVDSMDIDERILRESFVSKTKSEQRQMALDLGVTESEVDEALDIDKLFDIISDATDSPSIFLRNRRRVRVNEDRFNELMSQGDSIIDVVDQETESGLDGGSRKRRYKKRSKKKRPKKRSKKKRPKKRSKKRSKKR